MLVTRGAAMCQWRTLSESLHLATSLNQQAVAVVAWKVTVVYSSLNVQFSQFHVADFLVVM